MSEGQPIVIWRFGASLDGRIAAADGSSRWITSAEARADAHGLRATSDAVMVGSGTRRVDDPHLAVRDVKADRQPLRVVVDTRARTQPTARVLDDIAPTLIAVAEDADAAHLEGLAEVVRLPTAERGLDLRALLATLRDRGVGTILLEGGPTLAGSFLADDLIDRVVGYVAPVLIGGGGLASLGGPGAPSIDQARRLKLVEVRRIGLTSAWSRSPPTGRGPGSRCSPAVIPHLPNEPRNGWSASARGRPPDLAPMLAGDNPRPSEGMA